VLDCLLPQPLAQWRLGDCLDDHRPALLKLLDDRGHEGPTHPALRAGQATASESPCQPLDPMPEPAGSHAKPRRVARQGHCSQPWSDLLHEQ
jgi:hypothetical protein